MTGDELYMQRCFDLAVKGLGNVAPNPLVGSVIVHQDKIIGEGYHQKYGEAHAEVNAVNSVPENLKYLLPNSTLYVNLEPCSHHGKTPPCADMIISKRIPKVVISCLDPNPLVSGRGMQKLKDAGVEVITGVLQNEGAFLNRRFFTFHTAHRPYIILKWAQSQHRIMAPEGNRQQWLSGPEAKLLSHQWRSEETAILVGKNTVEADDPELTVRLVTGKNPIRITIDKNLSLPLKLKIFRDDVPVYIFNRLESKTAGNLVFVKLDFEKNVEEQIANHLYQKGIQSLIVEGGPATLKHFIKSKLWDEARVFNTPNPLQEGKKSPAIAGQFLSEEMVGKDKLIVLLNQ
jgi:diaminohydroxyphosphoribosylaminopyrimidine deaminase/5-amino-6-(5-phosphoribosylamino)uracil reductase